MHKVTGVWQRVAHASDLPGDSRTSRNFRRPLPQFLAPQMANHVWAYDLVFDGCANGQKLKRLTVVDEYIRECPSVEWFR